MVSHRAIHPVADSMWESDPLSPCRLASCPGAVLSDARRAMWVKRLSIAAS